MLVYLIIAIGSGMGGVARFALSEFVTRIVGEPFPWGTLIVNVTGCLVIGFVATLIEPGGRVIFNTAFTITARQFFIVGVLGGFTTFSAFSLQTLSLIRDGCWLTAGANVIASVLLCLVAVTFGHLLATAIPANA